MNTVSAVWCESDLITNFTHSIHYGRGHGHYHMVIYGCLL